MPVNHTSDLCRGRSGLPPVGPGTSAQGECWSVSDELWRIVKPLIPSPSARPQGGGMRRVDDRTVFTAIAFVLFSGCAWHNLPQSFGVTVPTAHRRFGEWTRAELWAKVHEAVAAGQSAHEVIAWSHSVRQLALARATRMVTASPPSPETDLSTQVKASSNAPTRRSSSRYSRFARPPTPPSPRTRQVQREAST
jgi:transposase